MHRSLRLLLLVALAALPRRGAAQPGGDEFCGEAAPAGNGTDGAWEWLPAEVRCLKAGRVHTAAPPAAACDRLPGGAPSCRACCRPLPHAMPQAAPGQPDLPPEVLNATLAQFEEEYHLPIYHSNATDGAPPAAAPNGSALAPGAAWVPCSEEDLVLDIDGCQQQVGLSWLTCSLRVLKRPASLRGHPGAAAAQPPPTRVPPLPTCLPAPAAGRRRLGLLAAPEPHLSARRARRQRRV